MTVMALRLAKFSPVASFRNLCIAGSGSVTAATSLPAFAGVIGAVALALAVGDGDMKAIGGYIVGALVILAVAVVVLILLLLG
ncbi:capsid protein G8P [Pseudomonas aeruginosa BL21]|nr:major capsid protein [Pseudomonas aeruginosa]ERY09436.1 capsid protein G8P [Pseudomonas aeruginosa BL21]